MVGWYRILRLPTLAILDQTSGAAVGNQIRFANTALARLIERLGAAKLTRGAGFLIAFTSGGTSFLIDVIPSTAQFALGRLTDQSTEV